jgi:hypothetical protein
MARTDENGVRHPEPWDPFEAAGVAHIQDCDDCKARMPQMAHWKIFPDPNAPRY